MNSFSFETLVIDPYSGDRPKNAVILLHGYGGDGKDISSCMGVLLIRAKIRFISTLKYSLLIVSNFFINTSSLQNPFMTCIPKNISCNESNICE